MLTITIIIYKLANILAPLKQTILQKHAIQLL
jgi:hypothetical protein